MKKSCPVCLSKRVKKFGKTKQLKQRYRCLNCLKTYIWKCSQSKRNNERHWFKLWIEEGFNLRQLSYISGHSRDKIKLIKGHWLKRSVPCLYKEYKSITHLIFDGTYFNKTNCLMIFMNDENGKAVRCRYLDKENYLNVYNLALELKQKGAEPKSVTLDGHKAVIRGIKEVWPGIIIQRCLYHIEHQGMMWLRTYPKTEAGRDLREIYAGISGLKTEADKSFFTARYRSFLRKHKEFINSLSWKETGFKDLKKAMTLINNAYTDMWHFLEDRNIPSTTNKLEGYFSELKQQYRKHKGMSRQNREQYFNWYCYYKNS